MNELTVERNIEVVTTEIRIIKNQAQQMALQYAIEIGHRLTEAKTLVPHGDWGRYLKDEVEFSQSTAQNFMKIYEEYGNVQTNLFGTTPNSQTLGNLPYTKALKLLALPAEEREEFVAENDVAGMSTRELEEAIRQKKEAEDLAEKAVLTAEDAKARAAAAEEEAEQAGLRAADAEKRAEELAGKVETLQADVEKKKKAADKAKAALKELREHPQVSEDVLATMRQEIEEETAKREADKAKEALDAAMEKQRAAEREAVEAKREAEQARRRVEQMEKAVKAANPSVAVFKAAFDQVQQDWDRMQHSLAAVKESDPATGERLQGAITALLEKWRG